MIWNIRKKKAFNQNRKKKQELKKKNQCKKTLGHLQMCQYPNHRCAEGEEEEQEIENLVEEVMKEIFPNLVKEIDM